MTSLTNTRTSLGPEQAAVDPRNGRYVDLFRFLVRSIVSRRDWSSG
jgi:hypothetical protein